ncbi:hypothetical protein [Nocardioides sp.]|uniref:hypothetical protein n=1 Tax=Nocardioides sp. TaxID=35761 RepID=UPI003D09A18C
MLLKASSQRNAQALVNALGEAGFTAIAASRPSGSVVWIKNATTHEDRDLALRVARASDPLSDVA